MDSLDLRALQQDTAIWTAATFSGRGADLGRQPHLKIKPSLSVTKIQSAAATDCTLRMMEAVIETPRSEMCFSIYDASANNYFDMIVQLVDPASTSIEVDPIAVPRNVAQRLMAAALVPDGLEPLHPADLV